MYTSILLTAGLLGLAQAQSYTPPGANTFGALLTPNAQSPVTEGQTFKVTWDPTGHTTDGSTVSLVLCRGPSTNCVNSPTAIVSGIPAAQGFYNWNVPCSLAPGTASTATGNGMLIIVDGTGEFQYSTQFSVLAGASCGNSGSTTATTTTTTTGSTSGTTTTTSAKSSSTTTSSSSWNTWTTWAVNNYTTTTVKPTTASPVKASTTAVVLTTSSAPASTTPVASPSPSLFHGAATKVGGSAAALVVAAGAAFFAL